MAGEMSQSEVTVENYPVLFALRRALKRRGIESTPRAFDQYQGPYLSILGLGQVWYSDEPDMLVVNVRDGFETFQTIGADHVHAVTEDIFGHGCYTLRQAACRIAELTRVTKD